MDDICVGDYVRTKRGIIDRVDGLIGMTVHLENQKWFDIKNIIKHSKNLIDLIEVGDYVNGWEVQEKYKIDTGEWCVSECCGDSYYDYYAYNKDIETVLTKEQFSSMQYIVKED